MLLSNKVLFYHWHFVQQPSVCMVSRAVEAAKIDDHQLGFEEIKAVINLWNNRWRGKETVSAASTLTAYKSKMTFFGKTPPKRKTLHMPPPKKLGWND